MITPFPEHSSVFLERYSEVRDFPNAPPPKKVGAALAKETPCAGAPGSQGPTLKTGALVPGLCMGTWPRWGEWTQTQGSFPAQGTALPADSPTHAGACSGNPPGLPGLRAPLEGKFLKTAAVRLLSPALSLMAQSLTGPGAADCNTCPASFPPLCCQTVTEAQGSPFLPGRSLGGKPVRPGSLPASGVSKGPESVATASLSPASGFPDLKALGLAGAQPSSRLGAIPAPLSLREHQWETDLGLKARSALSLFLALALGP